MTVLTAGSVWAQEPASVVSPRGDTAAFIHPGNDRWDPSEINRRRLSGVEFNPRNNTPWPTPAIDSITLLSLPDAATHEVLAPFDTTLGWVRFSPDGSYLSYVVIRDTGVEQWVFDISTGTPRPLTSASLNAIWGEPCSWLRNSRGMLCRFVLSARGSPPADPDSETDDQAREALIDYHFTSQLGTVMLATGRRTDLGAPGLYVRASATPDGQYVVVHQGQLVEIWNQEGTVVGELDGPDSPVGR